MVQGMKYYLTLCYSFLKISLLILELLGEGVMSSLALSGAVPL